MCPPPLVTQARAPRRAPATPADRVAACARCGGEARPGRPGSPSGRRLCGRCVERLRTDLCRVLTLYEESERALVRSPVGLRQRVSGSRSVGIVLDDETVAVRSAIRSVLQSWARLVADERGVPGAGDTEVRGLLRFLVCHLDWLCGHPAAQDLADEVAELLASAGVPAGPAPQASAPLGPCSQPGCGGTLRGPATAAGDALPAADQVRCEHGHAIPPRQWFLLAERIRRGPGDRRPGPATPARPGRPAREGAVR